MPFDGQGAEVVFAVRIVVRREGVEGLDGLRDAGLSHDGEAPDARCHKYLTREPARTEIVVQYLNGRCPVSCHSFCFRWLIAPMAHSERKRTRGPVLPNTDRSGQGMDRNTLVA